MNVILGILIAGALLGLTVWLTVLNKKTPVPEGCENLSPDCTACGIKTCAIRNQKTEGEQK